MGNSGNGQKSMYQDHPQSGNNVGNPLERDQHNNGGEVNRGLQLNRTISTIQPSGTNAPLNAGLINRGNNVTVKANPQPGQGTGLQSGQNNIGGGINRELHLNRTIPTIQPSGTNAPLNANLINRGNNVAVRANPQPLGQGTGLQSGQNNVGGGINRERHLNRTVPTIQPSGRNDPLNPHLVNRGNDTTVKVNPQPSSHLVNSGSGLSVNVNPQPRGILKNSINDPIQPRVQNVLQPSTAFRNITKDGTVSSNVQPSGHLVNRTNDPAVKNNLQPTGHFAIRGSNLVQVKPQPSTAFTNVRNDVTISANAQPSGHLVNRTNDLTNKDNLQPSGHVNRRNDLNANPQNDRFRNARNDQPIRDDLEQIGRFRDGENEQNDERRDNSRNTRNWRNNRDDRFGNRRNAQNDRDDDRNDRFRNGRNAQNNRGDGRNDRFRDGRNAQNNRGDGRNDRFRNAQNNGGDDRNDRFRDGGNAQNNRGDDRNDRFGDGRNARNNRGNDRNDRFRDGRNAPNNSSDHNDRFRDGRNGQNENNYSRNRSHVGFKYLESMLEQPVEEVMSKLLENKGFFDMLEKQPSNDFIVLVIKLISKFCDCPFVALRVRILQKSLTPPFVKSICFYIASLALQTQNEKRRNSYFWKDPDCFWNDLSKSCKIALREMPQHFSEPLSKILRLTVINFPHIEFNNNMHISDGIKDEYNNLIQIVETILADYEKKEQKVNRREEQEEGEPPDNFREISVYPTTEELVTDKKPFLRKNVIKGPYRDVEHYLDVQFRLLREDFVGPLGEGIRAHLSNTRTRTQNVKIHKNVQFLHPVTATEHYCALLKFSFGKKKKSTSYENSRRFMFGSLVCFTRDNFNSLIFGKVVDRDEKYMKNDEVVIGFDGNEELLYNTDYVMVECSVFFEPYYHVLNVMKQIEEEHFPMQRYIVDVDTTVVLPSYVTPAVTYTIGNRLWQPYHATDRDFHNFNPSQNTAFIAALTRQFSIIQGPPGTGKTFVGLKIAKTLLNNAGAWYLRTPMLVICYTNHALDQFLEGLIDTTEKIVRIGGQSKNENLAQFNLRNHSRKLGGAIIQTKRRVMDYLSQIKTITDTLNLMRQYDCVISFKVFQDIIPQFGKSWLANATDDDFCNWLLGTREVEALDEAADPIEAQLKNLRVGEGLEPAAAEDGSESEDDYAQEDDDNKKEEEFEDLLNSVRTKPPITLLKLFEMHKEINTKNGRLMALRQELEKGNFDVIFEHATLEREVNDLRNIYHFVQSKLDAARRGDINPVTVDAVNSQYISMDERWGLYVHWIRLYHNFLLQKHIRVDTRYREAYQEYNETKDLENVQILRNMKVIGMTTTGAARLHSSLKMIKSPIVIVEEAAEVLEAHIITSLTKDCKQLILIGDHKQLKPSTSNYEIERFYNLGISLFERMILNNVQCFTLNVQHRMRPEISSLIKPAIYPNLEDHETVLNRPTIRGVEKCLYFIDHEFREESETIGTTKKNMHEVKFLIRLAKYLILNGYQPGEVTILAAYLGQMFELKKERDRFKEHLRDVKITVLDNYQGEESDIILLSLVRNNAENKIGFLSIENRVCVALSRARNGLYVMGNMSQLCANSDLWVKIKHTLQEQDAIGKALSLRCQNHDKITKVAVADDFFSVVEGGCDRTCGVLLACEHNCQRLCHILDTDHKNNKCQEDCTRLLCDTNPLHRCRKRCYEECGPCNYPIIRLLSCNHNATLPCYLEVELYNCIVEVPTTLPCGHNADKPCHVEPEKHRCPFPCDTRLECGHACVRNCHIRDDPDHLKYKCTKRCEKPRVECSNPELVEHKCPKLCCEDCVTCEIPVKKTRTICPHVYTVPCCMNVDEIECKKPCKKELPCGHKCIDVCSVPCGPCLKKVKKVIPDCEHTQLVHCHVEPNRWSCNGKCPRIMSCGHVCERKCRDTCDPAMCKVMVDVNIPAKCRHVVKQVPCFVNTLYKTQGANGVENLESYCREPCEELLSCGPDDNKHTCTGTCGECFQGRIHKRCADKCGRPLVCNHECEVACRETCKPCQKLCSYKCKHSKCKKRCGEPCSICKEQCYRKCEHQKCKKICGNICSVPPCDKPCPKKLDKCGHPCVGFCGDPCPPMCRICDKEELEEFFFGTEDEDDARFVLLRDCGHVLESSGMEQWLAQDENEIKFKVCPKCKTTIYTTERYSDYIKNAVADIMKVKTQQYGTKPEIDKKRKELSDKIKTIQEENLPRNQYLNNPLRFAMQVMPSIKIIVSNSLNTLKNRLDQTNRRGRSQAVNLVELASIERKFQLIQDVHGILTHPDNIGIEMNSNITSIELQIKFILNNVLREVDDITSTEIDDIQRETNRLNRMVQFNLIMNTAQAKSNANKPEVINKIREITILIHSLFKYSDAADTAVKRHLTDLNKLVESGLGITELERQQIVKAIGLTQGHWYKCPNGHPYAIGDCGGAVMVSVCYECKAPIGGQSHRLLPSNAVASEMDGARHGAWPGTENMGDYNF